MTDWDNIVKSKKGVRSRDNISIGNVIGNYEDHIIVIDDVKIDRIYKIPKSYIENYNGSELFLNKNYQDLKILDRDFSKLGKSNSFHDDLMDTFLKGLRYMSGTVKIAIQNKDSLRIESADKQIKLHIIDPSIFDVPIEIHKNDKITDFFKHLKEAKEFAHKLSENELTLSILNEGENVVTLGKNANPSFSKLITRSDDIQIDSVRESIKLATDINKDVDK